VVFGVHFAEFGVHFAEGNCDHLDSQNLAEEPSIIVFIIPHRSDQLDVFIKRFL